MLPRSGKATVSKKVGKYKMEAMCEPCLLPSGKKDTLIANAKITFSYKTAQFLDMEWDRMKSCCW